MAFVFPGSGNHYLGMGRQIGLQLPEILRQFDFDSPKPGFPAPTALVYSPAFRLDPWMGADANNQIASDPMHMIFGQVVHGNMMARVVQRFGVKPTSAVIGYSLGESAGLFALGAWTDRDAMLQGWCQRPV